MIETSALLEALAHRGLARVGSDSAVVVVVSRGGTFPVKLVNVLK